jgi:hypothetical protein
MTGALVAAGLNRLAPSAIPDLIRARDRRVCQFNQAPPQGLFLTEITYPDILPGKICLVGLICFVYFCAYYVKILLFTVLYV